MADHSYREHNVNPYAYLLPFNDLNSTQSTWIGLDKVFGFAPFFFMSSAELCQAPRLQPVFPSMQEHAFCA